MNHFTARNVGSQDGRSITLAALSLADAFNYMAAAPGVRFSWLGPYNARCNVRCYPASFSRDRSPSRPLVFLELSRKRYRAMRLSLRL